MVLNTTGIQQKKFHHTGPHLPVNNLRETLDYYRDALGFYEEWTFGDIDGGIRRDNLRLIFAEDPEHAQRINNSTRRLPILWFVDNIDEIFEEFQDRGIEITEPLLEHPYGLREFAFIDVNGYYIRVAEGTHQK